MKKFTLSVKNLGWAKPGIARTYSFRKFNIGLFGQRVFT